MSAPKYRLGTCQVANDQAEIVLQKLVTRSNADG